MSALLAGALVASSASIVLATTAAPAQAAAPSAQCSATTPTCTVTYDYTGSLETFTVPNGVTSVGLDVFGAQGGGPTTYGAAGGRGGRTTGTIPATPGQVLSVLVGQQGLPSGGASYGGGGAVGWASPDSYLAAGGGGSFVFAADGDLVAAGGGGGAGGSGLQGGAGAGAGGNGGAGGVESFWVQYGSTPAGGGTQTAGGVAGYNANHFSRGTNGGGPAAAFGPGMGGKGGYSPSNPYFSGAGGGGGYYGGGGGGVFHGGGGGSGYAGQSLTAVTSQSGFQGGNGAIVVSYDRRSADVSLAASPLPNSVEGDSVTVTATVTSSLATPTSTVRFTDDGTTISGCGAVALDSSQKATCTTSALPIGTRSLVATYAGDGALAPTAAVTSYRVAYKALVLTTPTLPDATVAQPYSTQLTAQDGLAPYTWSITEGTLPPGLDLSSGGLLSGTPTGVGTGLPVTFEVQDAQATPYTDTKVLALTIAKADQQPEFTSVPPDDIRVGGTYAVTTSDGGSGEARQYVVGSRTTNDACSLDGRTVSFDHVGDCEIIATQAATPDWNAGSSSQLFGVRAKQTEVVVTLSDRNPAYGHTVTASALSSAAGTLQWAFAGADLGGAVTVTPGTPVDAPALWSDSNLPDSGSAYEVTATFVPADPTIDGATVGRASMAVSAAGSEMDLRVSADSLSATVSTEVEGGLGVPSGEVTFLVDNAPVGTASLLAVSAGEATATLVHAVPAGSKRHVTAVYDGDDNHTGASASIERDDPIVTASVTSAHPASHGWYRTPVTVTFTCTSAGAPLVGSCPAPVVLSRDGAGQAVSRTVLAQDGGVATASVSGLHVDRTAPSVRIVGKGRDARCRATDSLSGVSRCTLTRTRGFRIRLVATAMDRAGNIASTVVRTGRRIDILRAPEQEGRFTVRTGQTYFVAAWGHRRPTLLAATPSGQRPHEAVRQFRNVGNGKWVTTVRFARGTSGNWNLGVRRAGHTRVVWVRVTR